MSSEIQQGLMITVIGMGLVFAVIIFLWWLMGMLVKVTTRPEEEVAVEPDGEASLREISVPEKADIEVKRRAAAAAVAVALAIEQSRKIFLQDEQQATMGALSPWQSVHRARQLKQPDKRG
jgi:sodium pump decarboxylase gamma subunit